MPAAGVHPLQSEETDMTNRPTSESMRFLLGAACIVIISAGIKAASGILSLILLGFLLAYSALPLLKWIMHQFHLRKSAALGLAIGVLGSLAVVLVAMLCENVVSVKEKLPIYEEHARDLYQHVAVFLHAHSIDISALSATNFSTSNEIVRYVKWILPEVSLLFSDGLVVVLLGGILLSMIVGDSDRAPSQSVLTDVQDDVGQYVGVYATTGFVTALANLVLLMAFGVDFPLVWCILYFFLNFIPSIGFLLAMVPPVCLAFLMLGWKKALLVIAGLVFTQLVSQSVIAPTLLRKRHVQVSFIEKTISLLWWVFLLGPVGGILAIPLTLAMKRCLPDIFLIERRYAAVPPE